MSIDSSSSEIHVLVYRAGPLARLGHNHVVAVEDVVGQVLREPGLVGSSFELMLEVDRLAVDPPALRARYGEAFASTPSDADIAGTRNNMLSSALLDAGAHPAITVTGTLRGAPGAHIVDAQFAVKDARLAHAIPVELEIDGDTLVARGTLALSHDDLGLTPFSVMLGALRVADPIEFMFSLTARRDSAR